MATRTPYNKVREAFACVGLKLVSTDYGNNSTPLLYQCDDCGYEGEKTLRCVGRKQGCPRCSRKRVAEGQRYTLASAKAEFARKELELLEHTYQAVKSPMAYRCRVCGYEGKLRLANLLNGTGCRKCGIEKRFIRHRISFPKLKATLLARGIEVLSSDCKYHSSRIQVRCNKCDKQWGVSAGQILKCRSCRRCMLRERGKRKRYKTSQIRRRLKQMGITLLSEYVNSQSSIRVRFDACEHEHTPTWNQVQGGGGCPQCAPTARFTDEDYFEVEQKHGGKLLEKARNGSLPSLWRCSLGHVFLRPLRTIRDWGTFCTICSGSHAEMLCRTIVEKLFGTRFQRVRIRGMTSTKGIPLELDIYNDQLKLAVEHNGAHHYEPQQNWSGARGFRLQKANDQRRRDFCQANGILLIEVRELGNRTTIQGVRDLIRAALIEKGRPIPAGFEEADLSDLPTINESQAYWQDVHEAAKKIGLQIVSRIYFGADKPISVRCTRGHITPKTPRSIIQGHKCDECYMEFRKKPLRLSDGRVFESGAAAAEVLGVTKEIVNKAIRQKRQVKGFKVERITREEFIRLSSH